MLFLFFVFRCHLCSQKKFEEIESPETATVVRTDDAYLTRIHRLLLPADDAEGLPAASTFLLPVSTLLLDSKHMAGDVMVAKEATLKLEGQVSQTLREMDEAVALMERSLFHGKGSAQAVLTPLSVVEHQTKLQARVDELQPKLRQVLKDMETSEELQLRLQLFQWFCNDPAKLEDHIATLKVRLKAK